jgi:L-seryl-tRNA(Ser) seleniumtransferase
MPSYGVELEGDLLDALRRHDRPVIARSRDDRTMLDLRSVDPADDSTIIAALSAQRPVT